MIARATILALVTTAACAAAGAPVGAARSACPSKAPATPEVSARPGATVTLVPHGATSLLLCRYAGLNPQADAGRLERGRLAPTSAAVDRLAAGLDAIRPTPPGETFNCPFDDGSEILALFGYPSGPPNPVTIDLEGCRTATNGHVARWDWGAAIGSQLQALVG